MFCFCRAHKTLRSEYGQKVTENDTLRSQLAISAGRVEDLKERIAEMRADHALQIAKLEAAISEFKREASMVTNDILVSMGIRQAPLEPLAPPIQQAARHEDREDDENVGLGVVNWQAEAQRLEWEAYDKDQHQELKAYIAQRKAQSSVPDESTETKKEVPSNA